MTLSTLIETNYFHSIYSMVLSTRVKPLPHQFTIYTLSIAYKWTPRILFVLFYPECLYSIKCLL